MGRKKGNPKVVRKVSKTPEQIKKEVKYKNNLFNRYMLFRYSLATFFFANVYWAMTLFFKPNIYLVCPLALLVVIVLALSEQFKLYGRKEPYLVRTTFALKLQFILQIMVCVLVLFNQTTTVFPTFSNQMAAKMIVWILQALGMLLIVLNLKRIEQIKQNTDKYYQRFQTIEKYL